MNINDPKYKNEVAYPYKKGYENSDDYQNAKALYNQREGEIYELVKHDMLEDVGLLNHPKANKIWSYAWEQGHSSGYSEVYNVLLDLTELFK